MIAPHASVPEAVEGAEIVFCAAPIGALPALVTDALAASGDDVGGHRRRLDQGGPARRALGRGGERFIGGHPLAGAETAGVENARADLFEGARWYLTPTERSSGMLYDRLQRAIADLGARPQAIDAETHDRLMATVSHVPHVIANVLVREAAAAADEESERLPEVGPSFRDTTRIAGANPAIWADIFATNGEAVAREIDAVSGAPRRGCRADPVRRPGRGRELAPGGAAGPSAPARDRRSRARSCASLRVAVENRARDDRRDRPRPGPGPGQHRGHGPLPGAGHAHRRGDPLGRRADQRPSGRRGSSAVSATRSRSPSDPLRPLGLPCGAHSAPARQVDQPSRRAAGGDGGGENRGPPVPRRR